MLLGAVIPANSESIATGHSVGTGSGFYTAAWTDESNRKSKNMWYQAAHPQDIYFSLTLH